MKTVINLSIGGRAFSIEDDAYRKLDSFIEEFRAKAGNELQTGEIMEEVESRIAEIFAEKLAEKSRDVVSLAIVNEMIGLIGMPDGSTPEDCTTQGSPEAVRKFYLDCDDKKIAGVCSGIAAYFDIDVTIVRIIFTVALICGSVGFWAYIIFWIVAPKAETAAQKCEMRGIPATAENLRKFSTKK